MLFQKTNVIQIQTIIPKILLTIQSLTASLNKNLKSRTLQILLLISSTQELNLINLLLLIIIVTQVLLSKNPNIRLITHLHFIQLPQAIHQLLQLLIQLILNLIIFLLNLQKRRRLENRTLK